MAIQLTVKIVLHQQALKGISASEKIQSIREGTFEKKVLGE